MKTQHTPGPWYITTQSFSRETRHLSGEIPTVRMSGPCDALIVSLGAEKAEQQANARLIAAAPDLLESVKELAELLRYDGRGHVLNAKDRALTAIAKAEGVQ